MSNLWLKEQCRLVSRCLPDHLGEYLSILILEKGFATVIKNKNCSGLRLWPNRLCTHGTAQKTTNDIGDKVSKKLSSSEISISYRRQQKSNWQTTMSTWLKITPWAQVSAVCEKTFSTYFVPQPVENTTYLKLISIFTWYYKVVVSHE